MFGAACTAWEPIEQRDDKMEQVAGQEFEDKLVDAYFAEYFAVTTKRMESIIA